VLAGKCLLKSEENVSKMRELCFRIIEKQMRNMKIGLENDCRLRFQTYAENRALDDADRPKPIGCNRNAPIAVHLATVEG
jgi:hypothetical protein